MTQTTYHALWAIKRKGSKDIIAFAKTDDEACAIVEAAGKDAYSVKVRVEEFP